MPKRSRGKPRLRVCRVCGRCELVRKDNLSEQCRSCSARASGMKGNETRRASQLKRNCEQCGSTFPTTLSAVAHSGARFCSMECYKQNCRENRNCKSCGKAFTVYSSAVSGRTNASGKFCSKACYHNFLGHPGRINGRGSRWKKIRNETCRRSPFCALCGTIHRLDVHHIIPFRLTRDNRQINLVPLCKKHHKQVEGTFLHLENTGIDLETLHLWFCSTLLQWQNASRLVLKRLHQDLS